MPWDLQGPHGAAPSLCSSTKGMGTAHPHPEQTINLPHLGHTQAGHLFPVYCETQDKVNYICPPFSISLHPKVPGPAGTAHFPATTSNFDHHFSKCQLTKSRSGLSEGFQSPFLHLISTSFQFQATLTTPTGNAREGSQLQIVFSQTTATNLEEDFAYK